MTHPVSRDEGSVMLLICGLVPILSMLVMVGVDASVLFSHRTALAAQADAAALAAAQAADLQELYTGDATKALMIDCRQARQEVDRRVTPRSVDSRIKRARVVEFDCSADTVSVRLSAPVSLPFAGIVGAKPTVTAVASSRAMSPFRS